MSSPRIAVVGAGMAGLAATRRLLAGGASVVLVERGPAGGRAAELRRNGFRIERAPLLVSAREGALSALHAETASADGLPLLRPVAAAQLHAGELRATDACDPAGLRRLPGMPLREGFRLLRLERLARRFAPILEPDHPEHGARLDDRSVADFTRLYFGAASLARWAQPLIASDLGLECASTSRVALLRHHLARRELALGRLRKSVAELGATLAQGAEHVAGDVRQLHPLGAGFELSLSGGARIEAEAVVLAFPPSEVVRVAGDLLTPAEADFFGASHAEAAVTASFACVGAAPAHSSWVRIPGEAGLPLASVAIEPGAEGGFAPAGSTLVQLVATPAFSRAHLEAADDVLARSLAAALVRVVPAAARGAQLLDVARFAWARPRFDVGRYRAIQSFARVQADRRERGRRLYFAGDYLNAPTLDGAARSGFRAAAGALADFALEARGRSSGA